MTSYNTKEFMIEELCNKGINKDTFIKMSYLTQKCSGCDFILAEKDENCSVCYNEEFDSEIADIFIHLRRKRLEEI